MTDSKPVKRSVALAVRDRLDPSRVLLVRRPDDDAEFPGAWGLPAASCRPGETLEDAAHRVGRQKLGAALRLKGVLRSGRQERPGHIIEMALYEAELSIPGPRLPPAPDAAEGVTLYTAWRWGHASEVQGSARQGSLCSHLLIESEGKA